jgi:hypothetical protein
MDDQSKQMKTVFTVVDRGQGKSYWVRVGVGFVNKDGSLNLHLDAVPINGKLQVREWEANDRRSDLPGQDGSPPPRPRPRPQPAPEAHDSLL